MSRSVKSTKRLAERRFRRSVCPPPRLHALAYAMKLALWPACFGFSSVATAAPQGGVVSLGDADITRAAAKTTINQRSNKAVLDWRSFDVGKDEQVQFKQPRSSSSTLNRIHDQKPSQIYGRIEANGKVFLVNTNGIYFSKTARVKTASLVASSLDLTNEDFAAGNYRFTGGDKSSSVVNAGLLEASTGGSVSLLGSRVENSGQILAHRGSVNLLSGRQVTMDFDGDGLLHFAVSGDLAAEAGVENSGEIKSGSVLLSASSAREVFNSVVNRGSIRALGVDGSGGKIRLVASGSGGVLNTGTIDASGATGGEVLLSSAAKTLVSAGVITAKGDAGVGGSVRILGKRVGLLGNSMVDVSGSAGGGELLLGGSFRGQDADIANSDLTYVGRNASLRADALHSGTGGRVIVWSDKVTRFYGSLSAQGYNGGGFAEVSGKSWLDFRPVAGSINLSSVNGRSGELLLDPATIEVVASGPDINGDKTTGDDIMYAGDLNQVSDYLGKPSKITAVALKALLEGGDITLAASTSITFSTEIEIEVTGSNNTLTLDAPTVNIGNSVFSGDFYIAGHSIKLANSAGAGAGVTLNINVVVTAASITGTAYGDTFNINTDASITGDIKGGAGDDTFNLNVAGIRAKMLGEAGNDTFNIVHDSNNNTTGSLGTDGSIDGGADNAGKDTLALALVGPTNITNIDSTWNLNSTSHTVTYGANTFTIDPASNLEVYQSGSGKDTFNVADNTFTGELKGGAGNDIFNLNVAGIRAKMLGEARNDRFVLTAVGSLHADGRIDGDGGTGTDTDTDTLTSPSINSAWDLNSASHTVTYGAGTDARTSTINRDNNLEVYQSGSGFDEFNVRDADFTGKLKGGGFNDTFYLNAANIKAKMDGGYGSDTFVFSPGASIGTGGSIDAGNSGGALRDALDYSAYGDTTVVDVVLDKLTGNGFGGTATNAGSFTGIDIILGTGAGKLTGYNTTATWEVNTKVDATSRSSYTVADANGADRTLSFADFNALQGGTGADTFNVNATNFTGELRGGAGIDQFYLYVANIKAKMYGEAGNDTFNIVHNSNNNTTGSLGTGGRIDGGTDTDGDDEDTLALTIVGPTNITNIDSTWNLNSSTSHTVTYGARTSTINRDNNLEVYQSNSGNDTFNVADNTFTGELRGAGFNDTFNLNVAGIRAKMYGEYGGDTFMFSDLASIGTGGSIVAGPRGSVLSDTLNYSAYKTAIDVDLSGVTNTGFSGGTTTTNAGATINVGSFTGIDIIIGSGSGAGKLTGYDTTATWEVNTKVDATSRSSYTVADAGVDRTLSFADFDALQGHNGADTFNINATTFTGQLKGGAGNDIFNLKVANIKAKMFGEAGNDIFNLAAAATLGAGGSVEGGADNDEFNVNTADFAGNLEGGAGDDTFNLNVAGIRAKMLGEAGNDTFNLTATATLGTGGSVEGGDNDDTFNVNAADFAGSLEGGAGDDTFNLNVAGIRAKMLGEAGDDTFNLTAAATSLGAGSSVEGGANDDTFNINAADFTGTLEGGAGDDSFVFRSGSSLGAGGEIRGGTDDDTLDYSVYGAAVNIDLTGLTKEKDPNGVDVFTGFSGTAATNAGSFTGIDIIIGSGTGKLTGYNTTAPYNTAATWEVNTKVDATSRNSYTVAVTATVNRTLSFADFNALQGGTGADAFNVNATNFTGEIGGGYGADALNCSSCLNTTIVDVDLDSSTDKGFTGEQVNTDSLRNQTNIRFTGIDTIIGSGTGTLTGYDTAATWEVKLSSSIIANTNANTRSSYTAEGRTLTFAGFPTLQGHDGADTFNVNVANFAGELKGGAGEDTFNLKVADIQAKMSGEGGDDKFVFSAGSSLGTGGEIKGGADDDTLDYSSYLATTVVDVDLDKSTGDGFDGTATNAGSFTGIDTIIGSIGSGTGTLTGYKTAATWEVKLSSSIIANTNANTRSSYTAEGRTLTFAGFPTLQGHDGADTFNVNTANFTGELKGGAGTDTFNLNVPDIQADMDGESGADTFNLNVAGIRAKMLGGAGNDTFNLTDPFTLGVGGSVDGGADNDIFNINAANFAGELKGGAGDDTFNLNVAGIRAKMFGEGGDDKFVFSAGSSIDSDKMDEDGSIDGGADDDTLDYSSYLATTVVDVDLSSLTKEKDPNGVDVFTGFSGTATNAGSFDGIDAIIGNDTGTLTGYDTTATHNTAATWDVNTEVDATTRSSYTVADPVTSTVNRTLTFAGFPNLQGGAGVDTFNVADNTFAGELKGGAGDDTFNLNVADIKAKMYGEAGDDNFVLTAAGSLHADGRIDGGTDTDTLTSPDIASTWNLNSRDPNGVWQHTVEYGARTSTINRDNNLEVYQGGDGVDTFNVADNTFAGELKSGAGDDTFNLNVADIKAKMYGEAGDDKFVFSAGSSIDSDKMDEDGSIDGGADDDTLDYSSYLATTVVDVDLSSLTKEKDPNGVDVFTGFSGTATNAGSFDGIDAIIGNDTGTLTGYDTTATHNTAATWDVNTEVDATTRSSYTVADPVTSTATSTVNRTLTFAGFPNLQGGDGVDTFNVADNTFAGELKGGAGDDTFNLNVADIKAKMYGEAGDDNFVLTAAGSLHADGRIDGGTDTDTLTSPDIASTWNLNSRDPNGVWQHTVEYGARTSTINRDNNLEVYQGGDGVDTFNVADNTFAGELKGGAGDDTFNLNVADIKAKMYGEAGDDNFVLTAAGSLHADGRIDGGTDTDTLTSPDIASTWNLNSRDPNGVWQHTVEYGARTSTINRDNNLEVYQGGDGVDTFNVADNTFAGELKGGAGDDTFNLNVADIKAKMYGEAGDDNFVLTAAGSLHADGRIDGGTDTDTLTSPDIASTWNLNSRDPNGVWQHTVEYGARTSTINRDNNLEVYQGGDGVDTFNVADNTFAGELKSGAGDDTFNLNVADIKAKMYGEAGDDNFVLTAAGSLHADGRIDGGTDTDTLTSPDIASTWNLNSRDPNGVWQHTVEYGARTSTINRDNNLEVYQGGDGVDTFNVADNTFAGELKGGAGDDTFNLNVADIKAKMYGEAGDDNFVLTAAGSLHADGRIDGGTDTDTLTSPDIASTWNLNSRDPNGVWQHTVEYGARTSTINRDNNLEVYQGGDGVDTFNVADNTFAGELKSGAGDDTFNLNVADIKAKMYGEAGDDNFVLTAAGSLHADGRIDGGTDTDTLTSPDIASTWNLNSRDPNGVWQHTVEYGARTSTINRDNNLEVYQGGDGVDTFNVADNTFAGELKSGAGDDTFNLNVADIKAKMYGEAGDDNFVLTAAGSLHADGRIDGGTDTDTLTSPDIASTWNLNSRDPNGVWQHTVEYGARTSTINRDNNLEVYQGGDGVDTFNVADNTFAGELKGGAGDDTFNLNVADIKAKMYGEAGDDNFVLTAAGSLHADGRIDGGTDTDTLTSPDIASTWNLNSRDPNGVWQHTVEYGARTSTINRDNNLEVYQGGDGVDTFNVADNTFAGELKGGAGDDTLNYSSYGAAVNVSLTSLTEDSGDFHGFTGTTTNAGSFTGIDTIIGNGTGTLTGYNTAATWEVNTEVSDSTRSSYTVADVAAVNHTLSFADFNALQGGTGADAFNVKATNFAGEIRGGAGDDTLNYSSYGAAVNVSLTSLTEDSGDFHGFTGTTTNAGSFTGIDTIIGNGTGTLTGYNTTATWEVNTEASDSTRSSYTVADVAAVNHTLSFADFNALQGGTGADAFNVKATNFTGEIRGGAGNDTFNLNVANIRADMYGEAGDDSFVLTAVGSLHADGSIDGGADTDTLTSPDIASTWDLTSASHTVTYGTGADARTSTIDPASKLEVYQGGAGVDTFNVADNSFAGEIRGGAGDDTISARGSWQFIGVDAGNLTVQGANANSRVDFTEIDTVLVVGLGNTLEDNGTAFAGTVQIGDGTETSASWRYTPGNALGRSITGDGLLQVVGRRGESSEHEMTVDENDLNLPDLSAFAGDLVIGGRIIDAGLEAPGPSEPVSNGNPRVEINANPLRVNSDIRLGNGNLFLLGRRIELSGGVALGGTRVTLLALPNNTVAQSGQGRVVAAPNLNDGDEVSINARDINFVAPNGAENTTSILIRGRGGSSANLTVVSEIGEQVVFRIGSSLSLDASPSGLLEFLRSLGLVSLQVVNVTVARGSSMITETRQGKDLDIGLFEENLNLFDLVGKGIALSLSQCEEQEGCAPNISQQELQELIAQLKERLMQLQEELLNSSSSAERAELRQLIDAYSAELNSHEQYAADLQALYAEEDAEIAQIFAEEDSLIRDENTRETIQRINNIIQNMLARLNWLESLRDNPEQFAALLERSGLAINKDTLDAIITATRTMINILQERVAEQMQKVDGSQQESPIFTAETYPLPVAMQYETSQVYNKQFAFARVMPSSWNWF